MKYFSIILLCLFLSACGTFDIKVQISPKASETPRTAFLTEMALASASAIPLETPTLAPEKTATATTVVKPLATSVELQDGQAILLVALQMSDSNHGWAVESTGHVVKTSDGGWRWNDITPFLGSFDRHSLFALNSEAAWAVPSRLSVSNVVWGTRDGGVTWEASQPLRLGDGTYTPLGLQFSDARNGWLLLLSRDTIYGNRVLLLKSTDGGVNWEHVSSLNQADAQSYLPSTNTNMVFFDGRTGWLGGWWGKDDPGQWNVLRTVDGGSEWTKEVLPLPEQKSLDCDGRPVGAISPGSMAVEITCTKKDDPKYFYHDLYYLSMNGEPGWRKWKLPGRFMSVEFSDANQGWMMVASEATRLNEIQHTKDGGKTWVTIGEVTWKQAQFIFINSLEGWAIVGNGISVGIVHSTNGGKTWSVISPLVEKP